MTLVTTATSAWLVILVAGALEVCFAISMKYAQGYTRLWPSLLSIASAILSVWLMSQTLRVIPVGTAYAVWAGIGAAGTAIVGMILFQEPADALRLGCIALVVAGIVGLQMQSGH